MDNLSSSELDSPSKTPVFVAIAAILLAAAGLGLGWFGFSKATELEARLSELGNASERLTEIESAVAEQGRRVDQLIANVGKLSQDVSAALRDVQEDISKVKKDIRSTAIEAGTAKRMVEELEKKGVQVSSAPPPPSSSATATVTKTRDATVGASKGGVYTIKSGDTLGRIAAAYKITLADLQAANPGIDPRRMRIGQQVVIPAGK